MLHGVRILTSDKELKPSSGWDALDYRPTAYEEVIIYAMNVYVYQIK